MILNGKNKKKHMEITKTIKNIERFIIYTLMVMMTLVLILATFELGHHFVRSIIEYEFTLLEFNVLMDLFGVFLLVLIGIELLDTIKVYLKDHVVHVEVVVLVAIIALARKVVVMNVEEKSAGVLLGLAAIIVALAIAYFLIRQAGLCLFKTDTKDEKDSPDDNPCDPKTLRNKSTGQEPA